MTLAQDIRACKRCDLHKTCKRPVPGRGNPNARIMIVGEAPGGAEDAQGKPFCGPSGRELDRYLEGAGYKREDVFVTNVVKCRPPENRDPTEEEKQACVRWLADEFWAVKPEVVIGLGAVAGRMLLEQKDRPFDQEKMRGLFYPMMDVPDACMTSTYHPARALRPGGTQLASRIQRDFNALRTLPRVPLDDVETDYGWGLERDLGKTIALDTETRPDGSLLYIQVSDQPGWARIFGTVERNPVSIRRLHQAVDLGSTLIMHNAQFDLEALRQIGIEPAPGCVVDTMAMAYHLDEPQGLKTLAYRLCGMQMANYMDIVGEDDKFYGLCYLHAVLEEEWPNPEAQLIYDAKPTIKRPTGGWRLYQPQNIARTGITVFNATVLKGEDVQDRWRKIEWNNGRGEVEEKYGPMPRACLSDVDPTTAMNYACADADATLRIYLEMLPRLGAQIDTLWRDMDALPYIADMERFGIKGKAEVFRELGVRFGERMEELSEELINEHNGGEYLNLGSYPQMGWFLFTKLKLKVLKRTPLGKPSSDAEVLSAHAVNNPAAQIILDYRTYARLKGTYADSLPRAMHPEDQRIRTIFKTTRTRTGRLACGEKARNKPNLQNQPTRSDEGRKIKEGFIAEEGNDLLNLDFSQQEMRIACHGGEDAVMTGVFTEGLDIHSFTAAKIFDVDYSNVDKMTQRLPAKTVGFLVLYGGGEMALMGQLRSMGLKGWNEDRCKQLIKEWFNLYSGIRGYFSELKACAIRNGWVEDFLGRRYLIPEAQSSNRRVVADGLKYACNYPIQGGGAGIVKIAMKRLHPITRQLSMTQTCWPILQIHDSLMFETSKALTHEFAVTARREMEGAVVLSVPLPVDAEAGPTWAGMKPIRFEEDG